MARIVDLVDSAKNRRAGNWSVELDKGFWTDKPVKTILHYRTPMLSFYTNSEGEWDGDTETVSYDTGHGSVSDQNGMNKLFARLCMPFVYRRDWRGGGPRIERLSGPQYRWGITPQDRYDQRLSEMVKSVSVSEVIENWPVRAV